VLPEYRFSLIFSLFLRFFKKIRDEFYIGSNEKLPMSAGLAVVIFRDPFTETESRPHHIDIFPSQIDFSESGTIHIALWRVLFGSNIQEHAATSN